MNFAEEVPTPPVNPAEPAVEPKPAEPAEPAPAEPAKPAESGTEPAVKPTVEPVDPNKAKIDALQNSLDAAIEELSKGSEPKPAEPTPAEPVNPAEPVPAELAKPVEPAAPAEPAKPTEAPKGDEAWRLEMDAVKKSQEDFQSTTVKELDQMKLKDEMIGLTSEVQAAVIKYPDADSDRILSEVESGSDKTVSQIAQELHEEHQRLVDKISKEQEEKIKTTLDKENEGKIKVPQSSGTSSTPTGAPESASPVSSKASQDAAWAEATRTAKANLQGV